MQDINAEKQYVIYSPNESATCFGAGFWNNEDGWTEFEEATLFTEAEARSLNLPMSAGNDARFVEKAAAWAAYCGEQGTQIARVRLTMDVDYALGDETAEGMQAFLERTTRMAIGNGMLSGDTSAEVDEYSLNTEIVQEMTKNDEIARVKLTIDVAYELNEETAEDMRDFLERAAFRAIGNGMLSGDTSAVVDNYRLNVDVVPEAAENEDTQRPSMRP